MTVEKIDTITLRDASIRMDEVMVTGRAAAVLVKGDTLEYTTGIYNLAEHASVQNLLKLLPNVTVTEEGKIMVQGKAVNKILIDGKEFYATDLKQVSRSLPGKIVDKVQVIERSTEKDRLSGFDSGDKETVLNLDIKEENKVGMTLQAMGGGGHDINGDKVRYSDRVFVNVLKKQDMYHLSAENDNTNMGMGHQVDGEMTNNGARANLRKTVNKHLDTYANFSFNSTDRNNETESDLQTILSPEASLYDHSKNSTRARQKDFSLSTRAEWNPNERNTLNVDIHADYMKNNSTADERFGSFGMAMDTLYDGHSVRETKGDGYTLQFSADYAYRMKKKGRVLSTYVRGMLNKGDADETYAWTRRMFEDNVYRGDSIVEQKTRNKNKTAQIDWMLSYVEPVGKNRFLQLAYNLRSTGDHSDKSTYDTWDDAYDLLSAQSPSTRQESFYQRFTLNYKSVGEKTEYTVGMNVDLNRSDNSNYLPDDSVRSAIVQTVTNYSPVLSMVHNFNKSNQLRLDYMGTMTSPTARQIQDYTDISNPTNSIKGNPELKPQFVNSAALNFSGSNPKSQSFYYGGLRGQYVMNSIRSAITIDPTTGNRATTYDNLNGNWNMTAQMNYNLPIRNTHFTVGNGIDCGYNRQKGLLNEDKSTTGTFSLREQPSIRYVTPDFNCRLQGQFRYMAVDGKGGADQQSRTYDWGAELRAYYILPYKLRLEPSYAWSLKRGYGEFGNIRENILDIVLSREFSWKKYGVATLQLSGYDLLQSRKIVSRSVEASYIQNSSSSTLGSYFLGSFIYNFNAF